MSSDEVILPTTAISDSSAADPALVRFTEVLTETPDAKTASGIGDMLLIFFSVGDAILGALLAAVLYLFFTASSAHGVIWTFLLLVCATGPVFPSDGHARSDDGIAAQ
jgi:hypothetical protein